MKNYMYLLIALLLLLSVSTAFAMTYAQEKETPNEGVNTELKDVSVAQAKDTPNEVVNLELKDVSVKTAIEEIFKATGQSYVVDPKITGTITLKFSGLPLDQAIRVLTMSTDIKCRKENGAYSFSPLEPNESRWQIEPGSYDNSMVQLFENGAIVRFWVRSGNSGLQPIVSQPCAKCKKPMPPDAKYCPQCGAKVIPPKTPAKSTSAKPAVQGGT